MQKEYSSEFTHFAREEIVKQLVNPQKHSGKEASDIFPQPIKYVHQKYQKMRSTIHRLRERSSARVVPSSEPQL